VAAGTVATAGISFTGAPAVAAPAPDPITAAKQRLEDARREADDAAARFTDAQSSYEDLGNKVADLEQRIAAGVARRDQLQAIAERRAVVAYKTQGSDLDAVLDSKTPRESMRSAVLLDRANEADNDVIAELAAVNSDLDTQRDQLADQQRDQSVWRDRFADERKLLDTKVTDAYQALLDLQTLSTAVAASSRSVAGVGEPVRIVNGMACPLPGAAFSDDFGEPRTGHTHQGIDMFAPTGTPELAAFSGSLTFGDGGAGGMGAYIDGDNGVTYVYYHLSEYVGAPRHVSPGEVIGKVGQTGDATAPHLHFEMRPGGRSAAAIDPYPTLRQIC